MKTIKIAVSPDGNTKILGLEGFGDQCMNATKSVEQALGMVDESTRMTTNEIYESTIEKHLEH